MRKFRLLMILFFVVIASSCGQQKKYISYTVKKGETLKGIAKRLGIKTKDLLSLNPNVGRKPTPETLIIIPNKDYQIIKEIPVSSEINNSVDTLDEETFEEDLVNDFVLHKVAKGDTFYNLTRAYNVSKDQLNELNPSIDSIGLQLDMLLKIKPIEDEDLLLLYRDTIQEDAVVKLAMMLPFRAIEYDTIDAKDIFKTNKLVNITTDIYLG
ncbi:MAG: LysM peptidoglycan-binding domain-containing protein, partial [Flavobacteriaceae bacterium]